MILSVLAAEGTFIAGEAAGLRLHGYSPLGLLWIVPGLAAGLWAMARIERWRGSEFGPFAGKLVFLAMFLPTIVFGDWLQEAIR